MRSDTPEHTIRQLLATFTDFNADIDTLTSFMTPDYRQLVDGRDMALKDFRDHALALRSRFRKLDIDIQHLVCQNDTVATIHLVRATHPCGKQTLVKVIAFFKFREGRICLVDELTHILEGTEADKTLGSLQ